MVHLGIAESEQAKKQKILVDLEYEVDTEDAEVTDDLEDTQDYFGIYEYIQNFPRDKKYALLEKLYADLVDSLSEEFDLIDKIDLKIEKFPFEEGSVIVSE